MKILHTSDWHIGHRLYGCDREEEHVMFFSWLRQTILDEHVEALLVSGDIFDIGFPSNSSLKIYYEFLTSLIGTCCRQVIITGGNHDSVSTLEAPKEILKYLNVVVVGGAPENIQEEIIELINSIGKTEAVVCAVPFLRDKNLRKSVAGESYNDRIIAIRDGISDHYRQLDKLTGHYRDRHIPVIAMGHLFVQGATVTESERDIYIGNQASVNISTFPTGFSYIALGHLHRCQQSGSMPPAWYSGSPIALSFSEQYDRKQVLLIETKGNETTVMNLKVPVFRRLISLRGSYSDIRQKLVAIEDQSPLINWIDINVEEQEPDPMLVRSFEEFVMDYNQTTTGSRIIRNTIRFSNRDLSDLNPATYGQTLSEFSEIQVFEKLLDQQGINDRDQLVSDFKLLLEEVYSQKMTN